MHVANTILEKAFAEDVPIVPGKLQRILWFTASEYRKVTGEDLMSEMFEPWRRGPVIRGVHEKFRRYTARPIRRYAKDALGDAHAVDLARAWPVALAVDSVWERTSRYPAQTLSIIATRHGSPWWKARQAGETFIDREALAGDVSYREVLGFNG